MSRTFFAALLALCGLTTAAPAQMFYGGPTGYTSYYGPTYFHAPAYSPGYASSYSYTSGYRGGYGPLGVLNPATWFGWRPNRSVAYTSPFYGSGSTYATGYAPSLGYTTAYSPSYGYTASYSPMLTDTTSYYAPSYDGIALASYDGAAVGTGSACCQPSCCPASCCSSCGGCSSCASGSCPNGNCALNYAPGDMSPKPDPNVSGTSSGTSGSRTFESESGRTNNGAGGSGTDQFHRPNDGYNPDGSRSSGYRPQSQIQQKAPVKDPVEAEAGAGSGADNGAANGGASGNGAASDKNTSGPMVVPKAEEEPAAALNLDTKIAAGPSPLRERMRITARFGSPQLARAKVDPATLPAAADVRLVQK